MCLNMSTESSKMASHFLHFLGGEYFMLVISPSLTNLLHFLMIVALCSLVKLRLLSLTFTVSLMGEKF